MSNAIKGAFLAVVVMQAVHSTEEYFFKLYEVFPPMRRLYRDSPGMAKPAFIAFNVALVIAGLFCVARVWRGLPGARTIVWIWVAGEGLNVAAHSVWAIMDRAYNPGLATGLMFIPILAYLAWQLRRGPPTGAT